MAYTEIKPWILNFNSFSWFTRNEKTFKGTLQPGFCPYRPRLTTPQLYQIQELLKSKLSIDHPEDITSFVYDHQYSVESSNEHQYGTGFFKKNKEKIGFHSTDEWRGIT